MDDLEKKINKAIDETLPTQVGERLREHLTKGAVAIEERDRLQEDLREMKKDRDKLSNRSHEWLKLEADKEQLRDNKQKHEIQKLEYKITCLQSKYSDVISLMDSVFRNQRIIYRKHEVTQTPVNNNGYTSMEPGTSDTDTEKVEE